MSVMNDTSQSIRRSIEHSAQVIAALADQADTLAQIADAVVAALASGGQVLTAGHGGSAADALHMAEELVGRFDGPRKPLPAVALVADSTAMTCIANDFGYDAVFSRQVEALGRPGDALVIFSTSGNSSGLNEAVEAAKAKKMHTIALLGKTGGKLSGLADQELVVASDSTARIQEAHGLILHLVLEAVERRFGQSH